MAFGVYTDSDITNAGIDRRTFIDIACDCWFTSKGEMTPRLVKLIDADGMVQTVNCIRVLHTEKKFYYGSQVIEYECRIIIDGIEYFKTLVFYPDKCIWKMVYK